MEIFIKDFIGMGPLYYDEILLYYDSPQLFTLIDNCKNRYLSMLIKEDSDLEYLIINISKDRLCDTKDSSLSLREVFMHPEMNKLFKVVGQRIFSLTIQDLKENDLPDENIYLNMLVDTNLLISEEEKQWDNIRDSLNIRLIDALNPKEHEIDSGLFAKIITTMQSLITSQAKCKYNGLFKNSEIVEMSKLNFSSTYVGSIGIKFKSKERYDLIGGTKLTPILESLSQMIQQSTISDVQDYFEKNNYDYNVISHYKNYLSTLLKNNLNIEYKIGVKNNIISYYTSNNDIKNRYNNLNTYIANKTFIENYEGLLVAVDTKNKTFKLENDGRIISGSIPKGLVKKNYKVNNNVIFKLEVKQEKQKIGGNLIEKFKLLEIISQD